MNPGVVPRHVLPRRVIAPHRRWMPRRPSSRQRIALPGDTVLYNQAHRDVPGMQQPKRPHSTSARASGRYSRDTATRSTLLAADPRLKWRTHNQSGDFNSSSGVPPKSYTSVQPRGGGTRTGTAQGDPPQGGVERPDTSRFGTFSTPTCCPECSPS